LGNAGIVGALQNIIKIMIERIVSEVGTNIYQHDSVYVFLGDFKGCFKGNLAGSAWMALTCCVEK
jgi:hypothetical protein